MFRTTHLAFIAVICISAANTKLHAWHNWAGNHHCAVEVMYPETKAALIAQITRSLIWESQNSCSWHWSFF